MQDFKETLYALEVALYNICKRETQLSEQMRKLADYTEHLTADIETVRHLLAQLPVDDLTNVLPNSRLPIAAVAASVEEQSSVEQEADIPDSVLAADALLLSESAQAKAADTPESFDAEPEMINPVGLSGSQPLYMKTPSKTSDQFEMDLGIRWLSRIGIVALLIGLAMALSYTFPSFPNAMKILTGFIIAAGLFFGGGWLYKGMPVLGRILQGGGLSVGYLSVFATFFIPGVQLLTAPGLGLFSLFAYVGLVLGLAHRMPSQTVAMLSLAFGYYTAGYAESSTIALLSSGILSLGTIGLLKFHQDWKILPKINLLGALSSYLYWFHTGLYNDLTAQLYLGYTFLLFHTASMLRGDKGDIVLNQMNVIGFYAIYSSTQPVCEPAGSLEALLAIVELVSLRIMKSLKTQQENSEFSYGLVILSLLFAGIATMRYFHGVTLFTILFAEVLCWGFLSMRGRYRIPLISATYIGFGIAYFGSLFRLSNTAHTPLALGAIWMVVVAFLLEAIPFKRHQIGARSTLLYASSLYLLFALLIAVPAEWRTISLFGTGFAFLSTGFLARRKLYRIAGLVWVFALGGFSMLGDMSQLSMGYKILMFILMGIGLLGGSYGYSLLEKKLSKTDVAQAEAPETTMTAEALLKSSANFDDL